MRHLCFVTYAGRYLLLSSYHILKAMRRSFVKTTEFVEVLFIFTCNGVIAYTGLLDQTAQMLKMISQMFLKFESIHPDLFCVLSLSKQCSLSVMN